MPISCHFRDCKVLLVASLTRIKWRYNKNRDLYLYNEQFGASRGTVGGSTSSPCERLVVIKVTKGVFIATQLNSTRRRVVEVSTIYSNATLLNSTVTHQ